MSEKKEVLHPEEVITTFLLIRHGHTRQTEEGRLYTDPAAELTDKGLKQADDLARWLDAVKPDVLLSSKAKRVVSTATIIGNHLRKDPVLVEELDEWNVGDWEGRTYLDVKKSDPDLYKKWSSDPIANSPPGGESIKDMFLRTRRMIPTLTKRYEGKTIALITHAGIIRSVLVDALDMPIHNFWRIAIPVGSISRVDLSTSFATVQFVSHSP